MTISDAQFSAWLATDAPREILLEQKFAYESGGAPTEGTVYLSARGYNTGASDTPSNTAYPGRIRSTPKFQTALPEGGSGKTSVQAGDLELNNADGLLDYFLTLIVDGREGRFLIGAPDGTPGWTRADFRVFAVALAEYVSAPDASTIKVSMRDQRLLVDKVMVGATVDDAGRSKPIVCAFNPQSGGACQIEPVVKDATLLTYYVLDNFNASASVGHVQDNGGELMGSTIAIVTNATLTANAGTDTMTWVAHPLALNDVIEFGGGNIFAGLTPDTQHWVIAAGLTANDFRVSLTKGGAAVDITGVVFAGSVSIIRGRVYTDSVPVDGTIQLSSQTAGRLTVNVVGYSPTQSTSSSAGGPGELMRALLIDYGDADAADVDSTSFQAIYDSFPRASMSADFDACTIAVLDRSNVIDVVDAVARVVQAWWGPDHLGKIYAGRLNLSGLSAAAWTHELGVNDIFKDPEVENARVAIGRVCVKSQRNYHPLSYGELLPYPTISVADRAMYAADYRSIQERASSGTSYANNWPGFFLLSTRAELSGAFDATNLDLRDLIDEFRGDNLPHIRTIAVETDLRAYEWRLGDVVRLTYPRYGLTTGQNCRVIRRAIDVVAERVSLTLITQTTPDYSSASH